MAGSMVYRLRVGSETEPHMKTFMSAMELAQARSDNESFNYIAGFHGAPGWFCWHNQRSARSPTPARLFLPWHRAYLWWLEQALQKRVDRAALPWWDWTLQTDVPPAYAEKRIGGRRNPLESSKMDVPNNNPPLDRRTRRNTGTPPALPTAGQIKNLIDNFTDFASFSDQLQNYHDSVHVWVGGDMGDTTTAGFDPIFFAHHTMIDRIWYLWQVKHGFDRIPNQLLDMQLRPFGKQVRDVLDAQTLGYEYAATTAAIPVMGGGNG